MLTFGQAIFIGALQGITELFPISSLGHSVLIPALLHWNIDQQSDYFLTFLIAVHFATALVLLAYFWRDWLKMIQGFFRSVFMRRIDSSDTYARLAWLLIIATIPAGLIGLLFQSRIQMLIASPRIVAAVLIVNGALLYFIEWVKRSRIRFENTRISGDVAISRMSWFSAIGTGLMQCLALIPGFSRTGASLAGGLLSGLDHESAARFSFLLATPIIFAAAVLKLPHLLHSGYPLSPIFAGSIVAAIAAFFSVTFLVRYFKANTLMPFAIYCIAAGLVSLFLLTR